MERILCASLLHSYTPPLELDVRRELLSCTMMQVGERLEVGVYPYAVNFQAQVFASWRQYHHGVVACQVTTSFRSCLLCMKSFNSVATAQVFGPHVTRWIDGSQAALCARCRQLEQASGGFVGHAERLPDGADGAALPNALTCTTSKMPVRGTWAWKQAARPHP